MIKIIPFYVPVSGPIIIVYLNIIPPQKYLLVNVVIIIILQMDRLIRQSFLMKPVSKREGLNLKSVFQTTVLYQLLKAGKMDDTVEKSRETMAPGSRG